MLHSLDAIGPLLAHWRIHSNSFLCCFYSVVCCFQDEDNDGIYPISQIPAGDYTLKITKNGYNYPSTTLTVGTETDITLTLPEVFDDDGQVTQQNLVIVGAYACEQNTISLLSSDNGDLFHSFNPDIDARGIYLNAVDFDCDALTDIAVGGIAKGRDMLLYNTNRERIGRIITNGDDKGVLIAFGDLDGDDNGDFEIFVTNQSKDTTVNMYESDGKAIRALSVLDKKEKIRIATGDINGDGMDELVVVLAEKTKEDNVLVFDQFGTLINVFNAKPNADEKNTYGLVVTVADVDGSGQANIIVAEAEKSKRYGVAIYDGNGQLQSRFNAFSGKGDDEDEDNDRKATLRDDDDDDDDDDNNAGRGDDDDDEFNFAKCKKSAYKGKGLLLASGDVNGDGKADIIVARAGYRTVKLFDGNGQLIDWFTAANQGYQITALSYGERMGVNLPDIDVLPDDELENITIEGKPNQPRPVLDGQVIRGTVRVANVLIIKIEIKVGANFLVGLGTRFKQRASIPEGLDLRGVCYKKKKKYKKVRAGKQKKSPTVPDTTPTDTSTPPLEDIQVLDLDTPVIDEQPSVLEDIQVMLGDEAAQQRLGLRQGGGVQVSQDGDTGIIEVRQGSTLIRVTPVGLTQAALDAPAGVTLDPDGMGYITTPNGQTVSFYAAVHDMDTLVAGLDTNGDLRTIELDDDGQMRAYYNSLGESSYQVGRAFFFSDVLTDSSVADGVHPASLIYPELNQGVILVFTDTDGTKRWQWILPTPADRSALLALATEEAAVERITLHYDGGDTCQCDAGHSQFRTQWARIHRDV